ncbi:MAG TPA: chloride channel protein [Chromatiaceae bacterium]|nr:chloride channel protein [Chromatiaceae bacterium]
MKPLHAIHHRLQAMLEETRLHLARPDALLQLALLGLITGVLAGGVIVLLRLGVEGFQAWLLPGNDVDNFEALPQWQRMALPLAGALLLALMFRWFSRGLHVLGVARVLERMAYHQGRFTLRGFLLQFFGAAIALISGHSIGREGPHIFLGAAAGSLLGQTLDLPNNTLRTLVGCGAAAGIAASFNTPLAGVIFALEVIMLDYHLASFIPVIIAAVSATVLSNATLGDVAAFSVPMLELGSLSQVPLVVILGLLGGAVAAAFIQLAQTLSSHVRHWSIEIQMAAAGVVMAGFAAFLPQVMGMGYDTISATLMGGYTAGLLFLLTLGKLLATAFCSSLNVPGGIIGPTLFIGATLGGGFGHLLLLWFPDLQIQPGFYAMLGMSALMAGSLQAPLAALTTLLELTDNPQIIMPGMLVVVIAGITASELFRKESLFVTALKAKGLDYSHSPVMLALRRLGVASAMDSSFVQVPEEIDMKRARRILAEKPHWILISRDNQPRYLLPAVDLAAWLERADDEHVEGVSIHLTKIPGRRLQVAPIHLNQTLQEALEKLQNSEGEALYVRRMTAPGYWRIYGILTAEQIESAYR